MDYLILEEWARAIMDLTDPITRAAAWDAIAAYAVNGREPDKSDSVGLIAVAMCRRMVDSHRKKVENGRAGGNKKAENAKHEQSKAK